MPLFPQQQRLGFAFGISLALHALLIGAESVRRFFSAPPPLAVAVVLQARLLQPIDVEPVLKDTLSDAGARLSRRHSAATPRSGAAVTLGAREQAIQRKLAEHLFYPPQAVAKGLQGEVRLLLILDPQGGVLDARVASSSGHALLDQAAADAAYAMRRIPAAGVSELILPVVFKLQ
jgi:protein TonB